MLESIASIIEKIEARLKVTRPADGWVLWSLPETGWMKTRFYSGSPVETIPATPFDLGHDEDPVND